VVSSCSSVNSPSNVAKKRPLINISKTPKTPQSAMSSRLADYHMSKQNPEMLDRMTSPSAHSRHTMVNNYTASAQYQYLGSNSTGSSPYNTSMPGSHSVGSSPYRFPGSNSTGSSPYHSLGSNSALSPFPSNTPGTPSLLRQSLQASKAQSQARSSLVHLATQRSSVRLNSSPMSPGIVRITRGSSTAANVPRESSSPAIREPDPCDKDTVLSALRNKRYVQYIILAWLRLYINIYIHVN